MFSFFRRRREARAEPASDTPHTGGAQTAATQDSVPSASSSAPAAPGASASPGAEARAPEPPLNAPSNPPLNPPASDPPTPPGPPADPPPSGSDHPPPRGLALDEIARGMQHAAAAANQLLAHQYTAMLDQFFDAGTDGLLAPRAVEVALDAEHSMPVPLVALATPRGLALDRMVVHLTVRGDFTEALPAGGIAGDDDQRGRFYVTLAPPSARRDDAGKHDSGRSQRDSEHIDIEMQFVALAPPEAIMRVIDEYTHRLVPRPRQRNKGNNDSITDKEPSDE